MNECEHVWILNPGAEREVSGRGGSTPGAREVSQMLERRAIFDDLLRGEPRYFIDEPHATGTAAKHAPRRMALFWCPTPRALRLAAAQNLTASAQPSPAVLARVLSKADLSRALPRYVLPGHSVVRNESDWRSVRQNHTGALRAKRLDGFAGKGQRTLGERPSADDVRWLMDGWRLGGMVVEPQQPDATELSIHGVVDGNRLLLGTPCRIFSTARGAPSASPAPWPDCPHHSEATAIAECAARALDAVGYFGPFGVDLLVTAAGTFAIDLNARFTLGFSSGFGDRRAVALGMVLKISP